MKHGSPSGFLPCSDESLLFSVFYFRVFFWWFILWLTSIQKGSESSINTKVEWIALIYWRWNKLSTSTQALTHLWTVDTLHYKSRHYAHIHIRVEQTAPTRTFIHITVDQIVLIPPRSVSSKLVYESSTLKRRLCH